MLFMEPGYSVSALSLSPVRKIGRRACLDEGSLALFNRPFVWWLSLYVWAWSVGGRVLWGIRCHKWLPSAEAPHTSDPAAAHVLLMRSAPTGRLAEARRL
eukprot:jgi/Botrbrau1/2322/Bobra.39_1s0011.1